MPDEILPVLTYENGKVRVTGKIARQLAHGANPVFHGTAIIAAILPDGRLLLADKVEKQREKRKLLGQEKLPDVCHIYDIFGGHMQYDDIPNEERIGTVSVETYKKCALRELSEELLVKSETGVYVESTPNEDCLIPIGFYELENDHNREYTWAFVYLLPDMGPYASRDTLLVENKEKTIWQPLRAVDWNTLISLHCRAQESEKLSDAIGRILEKNHGNVIQRFMG